MLSFLCSHAYGCLFPNMLTDNPVARMLTRKIINKMGTRELSANYICSRLSACDGWYPTTSNSLTVLI